MLTMNAGTVALKVSELLDERGMTVTDLATQAGIAYNTAKFLVRGKPSRVDLDTLARVCNALGVEVSDVLVYEESEPAA